MCLSAICSSSSEKYIFKTFAHFIHWVVWFCCCCVMEVVCIVYLLIPYQTHDLLMFFLRQTTCCITVLMLVFILWQMFKFSWNPVCLFFLVNPRKIKHSAVWVKWLLHNLSSGHCSSWTLGCCNNKVVFKYVYIVPHCSEVKCKLYRNFLRDKYVLL